MSRQLDMESGSADSFAGADWPSLEPGSVSQGLQSPMNPVLLEKDYQANLADAFWRTSGSSASRGPKNKHVRIKPCLKGGANRKYWPHEGFMNSEESTGTNSKKSGKLVPDPSEAVTVTPSDLIHMSLCNVLGGKQEEGQGGSDFRVPNMKPLVFQK
ncbi:uncharacterized protein PGTG_22363 [Puccinia graminis f. sp. tritici CRL 75-36-700-3]|uniref:Uncharacterized protein n=1 Tax=Puccinia graminis f. sp. tritici (strain CRL 75-36-700-3 / race SCCL) TaxID=418459 RepID=H6QUA8_PUCGT|nr:uncharacterized protein PGTG_22363 [Puccinia graminis f. sp. tritici CRL 75-36-700-3]EHS64571.1 hypothetical protein PGTG_22363 [Puccinia graminis f. sp. tritici CRL 75-36-700-3]